MARFIKTPYARRRQQSEMEQRGVLQHIPLNKTKVGWAWDKVPAIWYDPECGSDRRERKVFEGWKQHEKYATEKVPRAARGTNTAGWLERRTPCAPLCRPGMGGWSGKSSTDGRIIFTRWAAKKWALIFTAECAARVGLSGQPVIGGGAGWEGLMGMLLTFSMPPPTTQQATSVRSPVNGTLRKIYILCSFFLDFLKRRKVRYFRCRRADIL